MSVYLWVLKHLPLAIISNHINGYPTHINLSYMWSFGSLAGLALVIQIITGVLLAMHYAPEVHLAFASVEHIMRDVRGGVALRYIHANVSFIVFIVVYLHMFRGFYYGAYFQSRASLCYFGIVIYFLMLVKAIRYSVQRISQTLFTLLIVGSTCYLEEKPSFKPCSEKGSCDLAENEAVKQVALDVAVKAQSNDWVEAVMTTIGAILIVVGVIAWLTSPRQGDLPGGGVNLPGNLPGGGGDFPGGGGAKEPLEDIGSLAPVVDAVLEVVRDAVIAQLTAEVTRRVAAPLLDQVLEGVAALETPTTTKTAIPTEIVIPTQDLVVPQDLLPTGIIGHAESNPQGVDPASVDLIPNALLEIPAADYGVILTKVQELLFKTPEILKLGYNLSHGVPKNRVRRLVFDLMFAPTGDRTREVTEHFLLNFVERNGVPFNLKLYSEIRDYLYQRIGESNSRPIEMEMTWHDVRDAIADYIIATHPQLDLDSPDLILVFALLRILLQFLV